ncbi:MAG: hypothetical protein ACD_78C00383G0003 [uncultured bacterium (gcode 4)]|uniref:DUF304 domain-containing protein n=1 Tax=uncultured bacterium (gcode 4) TaxID=1234023 RepID=K1YW52_9BACT|nr:MAG: hypothetical protein ACD_78C00383G0003 [uncultured bacterium (gcode 4)]
MNYFDQTFFTKYLREGEELLFVCHKHAILIIDRIILTLFFGLFIPGFFYYNNSLSIQQLIPFNYFEVYVIVLYFYFFYKIFDWYNDVWIITDQGVVDIDWNVFARRISYVEYSDIKWAEIDTPSLFDPIFNKGNIIIHTIADDDDLIFEWASNPHDIVSYLDEVVDELQQKEEDRDKAPFELLLSTLTDMVRDHLEWGEYNKRADIASREEIEKLLHKKGTIDLR